MENGYQGQLVGTGSVADFPEFEQRKMAAKNEWKDKSARCLQSGISDTFTAGQFTDVEIHVENKSFKFHKVILAAFSGYFNSMFSSDTKEVHHNAIHIKDISSDIFEDLLLFGYSGINRITTHNAIDLLCVAIYFQTPYLEELCQTFLLEHITPDNCLTIWRLACSQNCQALKKASRQFILTEFEVLSTLEEFINLEKDELISIIRDDSLYVTNEEKVSEAVFRWLNADSNRYAFLAEVFQYIRLWQVSLQYIVERVDFNPYVRGNETCSALVQQALKFHMYPERRETYNMRLRAGNKLEVILLIGIPRDTHYASGSIYGYNPFDGLFYRLSYLPHTNGYFWACCVYGDDFYLSGGTEKPWACWKSRFGQADWQTCGDMGHPRSEHAMVSEYNSLYVLGGLCDRTHRKLKCIEKYDVTSETWTEVGELLTAIDRFSVVAHNGKIYAFGGKKEDGQYTRCIQCFDTTINECIEIGLLPGPAQRVRCAQATDGNVYIVGCDGQILQFNVETKKCKAFAKLDDRIRGDCGLTVFKNKLFVFEGLQPYDEDGYDENEYRRVLQIDLSTRNFTEATELPHAISYFGSYKFVITKNDDYDQLIRVGNLHYNTRYADPFLPSEYIYK